MRYHALCWGSLPTVSPGLEKTDCYRINGEIRPGRAGHARSSRPAGARMKAEMTQEFKDHFSSCAEAYRRARPTYPLALSDWLAGVAPARDLAWDCATGSGQAARLLAARFRTVIATDASAAQLDHAVWHPRIAYRVGPAESPPLADGSVDLVTVAQAVHWLDTGRFFREVRRVLVPRGVMALWSCGLVRSGDADVDAVIDRLYHGVLGPYWPAERRIVDRGLADISLPFDEVGAPAFAMQAMWSRNDLVGYLSTWSSVGRYRAQRGEDPLAAFAADLGRVWADPEQRRPLRWPLSLRVGRT